MYYSQEKCYWRLQQNGAKGGGDTDIQKFSLVMHECQAQGSHSLGNITSALTFSCSGYQLQTSPNAGAKLFEQEIQAALGAERCTVTNSTGTVHFHGFIPARGRKRIIYIHIFIFLLPLAKGSLKTPEY